MSSVADKAAARRAKILARSKDRMATVTGAGPAHAANEEETEQTAGGGGALSAADADAALEAALNEVHAPPTSSDEHAASAATAAATATGADEAAQSTGDEPAAVADPHEFPSNAELANSIALAPMSPSNSAGGEDSDLAFRSFAHALHTATAASQPSAAYRRRQARESAAAASTLDMPLPPAHSPLTLWRARVQSKLHDTPLSRSLTIAGVMAAAVLAGLGHLEGGVAWLLLVQLLVRSAAFLYTQATSRGRAKPAAPSSRPAPSPPPMDARSPSADDDDVLELDTDAYTSANRAPSIPGFPAGFPGFPGLDGGASGGSLSALGLPPAVDTLLSGAQLFFKYAAVMRQLLNDTMLFLFVTVITNAALQLSYEEPVIYVSSQ